MLIKAYNDYVNLKKLLESCLQFLRVRVYGCHDAENMAAGNQPERVAGILMEQQVRTYTYKVSMNLGALTGNDIGF